MLFRDNRRFKNKFLKLSTSEFYTFILNNTHKIREDLRYGMVGSFFEQNLLIDTKEEVFRILRE